MVGVSDLVGEVITRDLSSDGSSICVIHVLWYLSVAKSIVDFVAILC